MVTASASQVITPDNMTDFLDAVDFNRYVNGSLWGVINDVHQIPDYHSGIYNTELTWTYKTQISNGSIYVTILTYTKPDRLLMAPYGGADYRTLSYVGSSGNYHQYKVNLSSTFGKIALRAEWDTAYTGTYQVISFLGFEDVNINISSVNVTTQERRTAKSDSSRSWTTILNNSSKSVPFTTTNHNQSNVDLYYLNSVAYSVSVSPDQRPFDAADSITFLVVHSNDLLDTGLLVQKDSSTQAVLPVASQTTTYGTRLYSFGFSTSIRLMYTSITFDLSGHNLAGKTLVFCGTENATTVGSQTFNTPSGYFFSVAGISLEPNVSEIPWYNLFYDRITAFLSKENAELANQIVNALATVNASVKNVVSSLTTSNSLLTSIKTQATSAATYLGDIWELLSSSSDSVSDFSEKTQQQVSDFEAANDQLNAVNKPASSDVVADPNTVINVEGMQILATPMNTILGNSIVLPILIMVATLALLSYVLFGKK